MNLGLLNLGALGNTDIVLLGVATVPSTANVVTGGVVAQGLAVTGVAVVGSTAAVITGGLIQQGIPVVGVATVASTAQVNDGGLAEIGVYTITPPLTSQIALMNLGAVQPGQTLGANSLYITGQFTLVPASTAQVFTGGVVGNGTGITGSPTVASGAAVATGGVVGAGLNIVGSVTVPSASTGYSGGDVELQTGLNLLGGFTIPSTAAVITGGRVGGLPITGLATIPSTAQVYPGGTVSGIPSSLSYDTGGQWSGRGHAVMVIKPRNKWDDALDEEKRAAAAVVQGIVDQGDRADQRGLAGLGMLDAATSTIPSQLTLLRRNFFERGKLLTPGDGGLANHTVLQFTVPTGYFGVLLGYYCQYLGTGFVQGSGDIVFRLKCGNAWVRNMGDLRFTVGDFSNTFSMPLLTLLSSDDTLTFQVQVPNTSGLIQVGSSYILCGLQGWLYPMAAYNQIRKC